MRQHEFIQQLSIELKKYKINDIEEIILDFEEHFAFRLEEGKTEEELISKAEICDFKNISKILKERKKKIPFELQAVVYKAMSHNPNDRYKNVRLMRDDIISFMQGGFVEALEYDLFTYFLKWMKKRKKTFATIISILILLFSSLTFAYFYKGYIDNKKKIERKNELEKLLLETEKEINTIRTYVKDSSRI